RVRRAREGAVAAVPDLAAPARAARSWPARALGLRAAAARVRDDPAVVPVALLAARAALRLGLVVARAVPRPDAGRGARRARVAYRPGTRRASPDVAPPSGPPSTTHASMRAPPSAGAHRPR